MDLYYQNETLYIEIEALLELDELEELKKKIFRIVEDYEVDNIIIHNNTHQLINKHRLYELKQEYNSKYKGRLYIK